MTGVIKTGLEKYVDKIPGTASINELQKLLFGEQLTSSERFCQSSELLILVPKEPVIIYVGGGRVGGIFFVLASKKKRDQPFKPIS